MSAAKIIPLRDQPAYKQAISKVVDIGRALNDTTERLERTRAARFELQNRKPSAPDAIERAMALVSGGVHGDVADQPTLDAEVQRLAGEERALREGLAAAHQAAEEVARQIGREIGLQAKARHVAAAKAVRDAVLKLCEANKAERAIRDDLERLGYDHYLPHAGFALVGDADDRNGTPAFYFMRESRQYVGE